MLLLPVLAALALAGIGWTIRAVVLDGYRPIETRPIETRAIETGGELVSGRR